MNHLCSSTVRLLTSSQVITSVVSVIKELIENSLDAGSSSIEVRLESHGLDRIEVVDNGCGVTAEDVAFMAQSHFTSKISGVSDLDSLATYGFRGEALGSLCAVSDVNVTTKTGKDDVAMTYSMDRKGCVLNAKPSHLPKGTTVSACHLFKNLPVRRQFYSNKKKLREETKRVEDLVKQFAVIHPDVRFVLRADKSVVWQKSAVCSHYQALLHVWGSSVMAQLLHIQEKNQDLLVEIEMFLPKANAAIVQMKTEQGFYFVNHRPVFMKDVEKVLKQTYSAVTSDDRVKKISYAFLHVQVSPKEIDVNLEPNKTNVLLHKKDEINEWISQLIQSSVFPRPEIPPQVDVPPEEDIHSRPKSPCDTSISHSSEVHLIEPEATVIKLSDSVNEEEREEATEELQSEGNSFDAEIIKLICDDPFEDTSTQKCGGIVTTADDWSRGKCVLGARTSENQPVKLFTPCKPIATSTQRITSPFVQTTLKNSSVVSTPDANHSACNFNQSLNQPKTITSMSNSRIHALAKKRKLTETPVNSILEMLQPSAKKTKKSNPPKERKSRAIIFSLASVQNAWKSDAYMTWSQDWVQSRANHTQLIGTLKSHGAWIFKQRNKLQIFQPVRAQEALIYQRLMASHILPSCSLENPLCLTPSLTGKDLWQVLMQTEQSSVSPTDAALRFTDPRFVHNGFELRSRPGLQQVDVTCMTSCVKHVGLKDIKFILQQISLDSSCSLRECRSNKVQHYLQSEATRIARQLPWKLHKNEVRDIWCEAEKVLPAEQTACFHARPYKVTIGDVNEFKSEQSDA